MGLVMHTVLTPENLSYDDQISLLREMLEPLVVTLKEAPDSALAAIMDIISNKVLAEKIS